MNDPLYQLLAIGLFILVAGGGLGLYADHQRRKYHDIAQAEREAERHAGS